MNNIFNKFLIGATAVGLCLGATSCNDELDLAPIDYPGAGSFWTTQEMFTTNIYALSNMFRANYPANILFYAGEFRSGSFTIDLINGSGAINVEPQQNIFDAAHPQFTNFGGYFGFIAGLNELIYETNNAKEGLLSDGAKNGLLAIAHGWRAYCYFQMYRMYGGVPLRETPDVILGETDPEKLRMPRATAQETLNFIKKDIDESIKYFDAANGWSPYSPKNYYWSKACTEMLAGEVYLWSAKVATGDHELGGASDIAKAKQYFEHVKDNYGYALLDDYFSVWTTPQSSNKEAIYSICYSSQSDGSTFWSYQANMLWSKSAGAGTVAWSIQDETGLGIIEDGSASRFGFTYDPATGKNNVYTCWANFSPSPNRYMYKNAIYFQFDDKDLRKKMFFPQWAITEEEEDDDLQYIANFDPKAHNLMGTFILKYRPSIIASWSPSYNFYNDATIYRLPLAILSLAEIANYEGNSADVEKYINQIRKRAYGANWDEATHGYIAGDFRQNENAIFREKEKEFIQEGQRWWDMRRMTVQKDGPQTAHFAFQPEGCAGFGLDPAANKWLVDGNGDPIETTTPWMTASEEYKLLWPIDQTLLGSDPLIVQNPGYQTGVVTE